MDAQDVVQTRDEQIDRVIMALTGSIKKNEADSWRQHVDRVKHFVDGAEFEAPTSTENSTVATHSVVREFQNVSRGKNENPPALSQTSASSNNGRQTPPPPPMPSAYATGNASVGLFKSPNAKANIARDVESGRKEPWYEFLTRHVEGGEKLCFRTFLALLLLIHITHFVGTQFEQPALAFGAPPVVSQKQSGTTEEMSHSWTEQNSSSDQSRRERKGARRARVRGAVEKAK